MTDNQPATRAMVERVVAKADALVECMKHDADRPEVCEAWNELRIALMYIPEEYRPTVIDAQAERVRVLEDALERIAREDVEPSVRLTCGGVATAIGKLGRIARTALNHRSD